jgi:hypothetical protein
LQEAPAGRRQAEGVGPAVDGIGDPFDQAALGERIDQHDHSARRDLQRGPDRLLRLVPAGADGPQEKELAGLEVERLETGVEAPGDTMAHLRQQQPDRARGIQWRWRHGAHTSKSE